MTTITIPNNLISEKDLVVIPRFQYEQLLSFKNSFDEIERGIQEGLDDAKNNRTIGPFTSLASGLKALKKKK